MNRKSAVMLSTIAGALLVFGGAWWSAPWRSATGHEKPPDAGHSESATEPTLAQRPGEEPAAEDRNQVQGDEAGPQTVAGPKTIQGSDRSAPEVRPPSVPFWTLGINNLFAREYVFSEAPRELTEEAALEFTKRTLEADGHDTSVLAPVEYPYAHPEEHTERLFVRNTLDPNAGRVSWGPKPGGPLSQEGGIRTYNVRIWRDDEGIHCLVFLPK